MEVFPRAKRAAVLKTANARADCCACIDSQSQTLLTPPARTFRPQRRQRNILGEEEKEVVEGKEDAQMARQLEREQADQIAARAAKRQRIEHNLQTRVNAAKRAAAAVE